MGLSWDEALASITLNPAKVFGMDKELGSLEVGKRADVVVWDGDPLELMSAPTAVFIDGQTIPLVSRQTELRDRYLNLDESTLPVGYRR
ncbi:amidohydrolase family protein [Hankyongella ginsenosidimutans]|uniref:amidohydrolase family protein n=1 Tax=Hankyongella ginsenosidimutans TaxID=1763828 RepID=UPI00319E590A